jgi:hypothetical protein
MGNAAVLRSLAPREATFVADRAATDSLTVPLDSVVALARAGAEPDQVLRLLRRQIDQLSTEDVFRLFGAMPEPYASVTDSTAANPTLIPAAHRDLFERLKTARQLHSVEKVRSKPMLKVARFV